MSAVQQYWLPGYGISRQVVLGNIHCFLGPSASIRPFIYQVCHTAPFVSKFVSSSVLASSSSSDIDRDGKAISSTACFSRGFVPRSFGYLWQSPKCEPGSWLTSIRSKSKISLTCLETTRNKKPVEWPTTATTWVPVATMALHIQIGLILMRSSQWAHPGNVDAMIKTREWSMNSTHAVSIGLPVVNTLRATLGIH